MLQRGGKTRQRKEREPEEARDGNSKDVQKQDSGRKAVEAQSQCCCECLLEPFRTRPLAKYPNTKAPQHTPRCRASGPGGWGQGADLSWEAAEEEVEEVGGWGAAAVP